jgi:hypothetical protein
MACHHIVFVVDVDPIGMQQRPHLPTNQPHRNAVTISPHANLGIAVDSGTKPATDLDASSGSGFNNGFSTAKCSPTVCGRIPIRRRSGAANELRTVRAAAEYARAMRELQ